MPVHRALHFLLLRLGAVLLASASASAATGPDAPRAGLQLRLSWIDAQGMVKRIDWKYRAAWVWKKASSNKDSLRPALRLRLEVPSGQSVGAVRGKGFQFAVENTRTEGSDQTLVLDVDAPTTSLELALASGGAAPSPKGLLVQVHAPETQLRVHPACDRLGVSIARRRDSQLPQTFYAGLHCAEGGEYGEFIVLSFFLSEDSAWKGATLPGKLDESPRLLRFKVKRAAFDDNNGGAIQLGSFALGQQRGTEAPRSPSSGSVGTYTVTYQAPPPPSRWAFSAALGTTYLSYHEDPIAVEVSELGLTGKVNALYRLVPGKLDFGANAFGTIMPYALKTGGAPAARFYGVNARLGYHLPLPQTMRRSSLDLTLSAGWYFWGMIVPEETYGVTSLMGPQAFVSLRKTMANGRALFGYMKFASISDGGILSDLGNREIAGGGGLELSPPGSQHPWSLTLDLAAVQFASSFVPNTLTMFSSSLGLQVGL